MKNKTGPTAEKGKGRGAVTGLLCAALTALLLTACGRSAGPMAPQPTRAPAAPRGVYTVGTDIPAEEITEFYFTRSASTYPPHYQRYRLYAEDGKRFFFHEKREGDHWPLTEADATVTGTRELTEAEWTALFDFLRDGTVKKRAEDTSTGGSGPWLYLYWTGDKGKYQEFSFASLDARAGFEDLCVSLAAGN